MEVKNFIIDIDGVICEDITNEEKEKMPYAKEIQNAKEQINKWFEQGHKITFFTAITNEHKEITEKWLKEHDFKYHNIIFNKPRGGNYHYIDNLNIKATKFNGKFTDLVYKDKKIEVFDD